MAGCELLVWRNEGRGGKLQEFMTRGSMSLSSSDVTTAVGNMRGGLGLNRVEGAHFRVKCLTIGKSIETGSPCMIISTFNLLASIYLHYVLA